MRVNEEVTRWEEVDTRCNGCRILKSQTYNDWCRGNVDGERHDYCECCFIEMIELFKKQKGGS